MKKSTTEVTSNEISSDNPIHQRLLYAYIVAKQFVKGDMLEIGCGVGRGIEELKSLTTSYTAIDKNDYLIGNLSKEYPDIKFINENIPPFKGIADNSFDSIVTFQVIEHIQNDELFLKEIARVLKPGGKAYVSTPNITMTLSRNPWHIREYTAKQLEDLGKKYFSEVNVQGVGGNEKVMEYYEQNKASVHKIMKWDVFNLQYLLPASVLKVPYEILNRRNRNKLEGAATELTKSIHHTDFCLLDDGGKGLDLFATFTK